MQFLSECAQIDDAVVVQQRLADMPDSNGLITINVTVGITDYAPLINAALRTGGVVEVRLGAGIFAVSSALDLPSGAHLTGAGAGLTLVQAAPGFVAGAIAAVIHSEYRAVGITLADLSVDASKLSPDGLRLNGVFMDEVVGFDIARVDVYNVTGYAQFARGDVGALVAGVPTAVATTGSYTDCNTYNAQVHFEVMFGDGVTYTNCTAADGDGDISAEAYFHPLLGSRNISYIGVSAFGDALIGFSLISAYRSLENISIINSHVEIDRPASGYGLLDLSGLPTLNLQIVDSSFISREYIGFAAIGITGSASGSTFQGGVIGLNIENLGDGTPPNFAISDSHALAVLDPNILAGIVGVQAVAGVTFAGGTIAARGSGGLAIPVSGDVVISPQTALIQAGFDSRVVVVGAGPGPGAGAGDLALLFPLVALPAGPFGSFAGGEVTVTFRNPVAATDGIELVSGGGITVSGNQISYNGALIGARQAGAAAATTTIALTAAATGAAVEALVRSIAFTSGGTAPGMATRLIEVVISDGSGLSRDLNAAVHTGDVQGGLTDDLFIVSNPAALILESSGYGIDEVRTALAEYTLPDNVDNLTAIGDGPATLHGNALANVITGGAAADMLLGGAGDDVYYVTATDTVIETADQGYDTVYASGNYLLAAGAQIELLSAADSSASTFHKLTGNDFANVISGNAGVNRLFGGGGDDQLFGLSGDDILDGGDGSDLLSGGAGNDAYYAEAGDTIIEAANGGNDTIRARTSFTLAAGLSIETLLTADKTAITAIALTGNERANTIVGNAGANWLDGMAGDDVIYGRDGDDVLNGGDGADVLTGNAGADTFRFDTVPTSSALLVDRITDFEAGDLIDVSAFDPDVGTSGDQAFTFIGAAGFSLIAGQLRAAETTAGQWLVEGDLNGDGEPDFAIQVSMAGPGGISGGDFLL